MGLVVNASQNPIKLSNNLSRCDGLLSFAVSSLSAGARPKDVKDGTADFGVKKIKITKHLEWAILLEQVLFMKK